jgi:SAM-dependent methyltransferase
MNSNKHIQRDEKTSSCIFDRRSLQNDYHTLIPALRPGMQVLDVGCGTGAISRDIAIEVGSAGKVTGIDNTAKFIESGKITYGEQENLELVQADLFEYNPDITFDVIVAARMLQWLKNPLEALLKMKSLLKPHGFISVLDYNHELIKWKPQPPQSMLEFYRTFLRWRADAGLTNNMANALPPLFFEAGLNSVEFFRSDEHYTRDRPDFKTKVGIWSVVAGSTQMVDEGYLDNQLRLQAIEEYNHWVENEAESMTMKLKEVRGWL